jgi:hypothetical protein
MITPCRAGTYWKRPNVPVAYDEPATAPGETLVSTVSCAQVYVPEGALLGMISAYRAVPPFQPTN